MSKKEASRMTLMEHLTEFRRRIVISLIAIAVRRYRLLDCVSVDS